MTGVAHSHCPQGKLVSIDPGKNHVGYAVWYAGKLQEAGVADVGWHIWLRGIDEIVIEKPVIRERGVRDKKTGKLREINKNAIVDLAVVVGWFAGAAYALNSSRVTYYRPEDWKNQLPKEISHERSLRALSAEEREMIVLPKNKKLALDILDAVGIGLHHLGRARPS